MPSGFTGSLAERLNSMSQLEVKEAVNGEIIMPGCAYIAPGDYHLGVKNCKDGSLKIKLLRSSPVNGHRPSVDVMLESISQTGRKGIIAVIMTGMGKDGSEGIKKIKKNNNGYIIAQDESSCVVYGMPKAAIETGLVDMVVQLENIADAILKIMGVK
jgi:two-component system chemotaxis response regulator CheB